MKVLMVGLGSIGKRHVQNIVRVLDSQGCAYQIDAFRSTDRALDDAVKVKLRNIFYDTKDIPQDYDVIFVTNPTIMHFETIQRLQHHTRHMFIEKPVFDCFMDLSQIRERQDSVYYVACPLRHKPVLKYVKDLIESGEKIYSVRAISSSYLPNWRKGTDYRQVYSARKELGGGVELDLIHEWDYLTYFFGMPNAAHKFVGKVSALDMNAEDIAVYIAQYDSFFVELHLDYFGIESERKLELYGEQKKYLVNLITNQIRIVYENEEQILEFEDDFYYHEMKYFFELLCGKHKNFNSIERANELIGFLEKIK